MRTKSLEDVVAGHIARNLELCKVLESKGVDLAVARFLDLHFWADDELAAHRLAAALRERGYAEVTLGPTEAEFWNVEAEIEAPVVDVVETGFVEQLAQLARDNRGEFDGWGTEV
jgi:hypothetical protein